MEDILRISAASMVVLIIAVVEMLVQNDFNLIENQWGRSALQKNISMKEKRL